MNLCIACQYHWRNEDRDLCKRSVIYESPVDGLSVYATCQDERRDSGYILTLLDNSCGIKGRFFKTKETK